MKHLSMAGDDRSWRLLRSTIAIVLAALSSALWAQPALQVPLAVSSAAAANRAVDVLVLLDDAQERSSEIARAAAAIPLHLASQAEYGQRLATRQVLLDSLKLAVKGAVVDSDLEVVTEYSALPILHLRVHSAAALARLSSHAKVLSIDENRVSYRSLVQSLPLIRRNDPGVAGHIGTGRTVAVLDSGVDYTRSAFGSCSAPGGSCKVVAAQDFAPSDGSLDDDGHGTNVAGIVLGVAPGARIAALDVFTGDSAFTTDIISAINWCVTNKAVHNIAAINMSLGGGRNFSPVSPTDSWGVAIQAAVNAGIVVVAASGNDGFTDSLASPAAYTNVLSVGALYDASLGDLFWSNCTDFSTSTNQVTCFSNSASFLGMLAPGALIDAAGLTQGGTSQASPHVAGAAAVLRAAFPADTVAALVTKLKLGPQLTDPRNGIAKRRLDLVASLAGAPGLPTVRFGAATYSVTEGTASILIAVTRSSTTGAASVHYATANGTATAGTDYTARSGTVSFAAGGGSANISIPITNDTAVEGNETFTVSLDTPVNLSLGEPSLTTVTIVDNDAPTLSFGAAAYSVSEGAPSISIPIIRTSTIGTASFCVATADGTATSGLDYGGGSACPTFDAGVGTLNLQVAISNDTAIEGNETFTLALSSLVGVSPGPRPTTTVTIIDDDLPPYTVSIGAATYSVGEGGGSIVIPVTRSRTTGTASVAYATANGTATAGTDYTARSGTLSFGAGVSSANITVPITNDTAFEGNETFTVALGFPSPVDMLLGAIATTTVTIVDNDVPATVAFGAASYSVSEGTASIVIPVIRSSTTGTASVAFATANGTATAGSDYTARSGTLAFAAGIGSMNISVPITNDTAADGNETFTVSLSAPVSLVLGSPIMTTVSIIDNDVPAQSRLSVYRYGLGGVTSTPAGIDCNPPRPASFLPTLCNVSFPSGGSVNLQATPMPGWAFVAWSGACTGTNPVCTVSMTSAKSAVAIFRTDSALGSAVESPSLPWVTDGNNVWAAQSGTWVVGGSALQSGVIDHSQATSVRTTVTGPGLLTFRWRVSSEANFDFLLLIFDGWEQAGISGDSGWQQQTWFVPEGPHELGWTYRKDSSVVRLSDAGWLDEVIFTPGTGFSSAGKALSATRSSAPTRQTFGPVLPKP